MSTLNGHEPRKLRRVLGFWAAYGCAVGLVVSGTAMFTVGHVAGVAGYATFIAAFIALVPMMAAAFAFGELTAMLPGGGMISDYTLPALGRFWGVFALLSGYVLLIACDGGSQLVMGGLATESLLGIPQPVVTGLMFAFIIIINYISVDFFGKVEATLSIALMIIFVVLAVVGTLGLGESMGVAEPVNAGMPILPEGGLPTVLGYVGITIWFYIGFEFACPMAEENKRPHKNIPYGLILGLITICAVKVTFSIGAAKYSNLELLQTSPIPHVEAATAMLGTLGFATMTILTILCSFTTGNMYAAGLPRMLYGLARENMVPSMFAKIHPKFRTPTNGVIFTGVLILITMIIITIRGADPDIVLTFIMTACICWMISYAIAMIDVLVLRKKYPDYPRLWKAPFAYITLPIGMIGVIYCIVTLADYLIYSVIAMAIVALYAVVWMKYKKIEMFKPVPIENIATEIRNRSEYLPEWDEAVAEWLAKREKK